MISEEELCAFLHKYCIDTGPKQFNDNTKSIKCYFCTWDSTRSLMCASCFHICNSCYDTFKVVPTKEQLLRLQAISKDVLNNKSKNESFFYFQIEKK